MKRLAAFLVPLLVITLALACNEVNVSFSSTDHGALQTGRMLRAVVEDGKGRWEYFGPLYEFEEAEQE